MTYIHHTSSNRYSPAVDRFHKILIIKVKLGKNSTSFLFPSLLFPLLISRQFFLPVHSQEASTVSTYIVKTFSYYQFTRARKCGNIFRHTEKLYSSDTRQSMKRRIVTERLSQIYSQMRLHVMVCVGPKCDQLGPIHYCLLEESQ